MSKEKTSVTGSLKNGRLAHVPWIYYMSMSFFLGQTGTVSYRWVSVKTIWRSRTCGILESTCLIKRHSVEMKIKVCLSSPYLTMHLWQGLAHRLLIFWLLCWLNIVSRKNVLINPYWCVNFLRLGALGGLQSELGGLFWIPWLNWT